MAVVEKKKQQSHDVAQIVDLLLFWLFARLVARVLCPDSGTPNRQGQTEVFSLTYHILSYLQMPSLL